MSGGNKPSEFVLDREACLKCAADPKALNAVGVSTAKLYTPSCIRKLIRKLDSGGAWTGLETNLGLLCYPEDAEFFKMCGSLRDVTNALSPVRANFEEEKLHIIAVARILDCVVISGDSSTSSSSIVAIAQRFSVVTVLI